MIRSLSQVVSPAANMPFSVSNSMKNRPSGKRPSGWIRLTCSPLEFPNTASIRPETATWPTLVNSICENKESVARFNPLYEPENCHRCPTGDFKCIVDEIDVSQIKRWFVGSRSAEYRN